MTDLTMAAVAAGDALFLERVVCAGLERRVWNGRPGNAAGATLAGGAMRVYEQLRDFAPIRGVFVCGGDERGPGCGLVFTASRRSKRCPLCNKSPIAYSRLPGDVVIWADPWDSGCRKLRLYRVCQHCRETAFEATRMDALYCSKRCKTAAHRASHRPAGSPIRVRV